jgi:N6-adenosine-specific RNA methylase IME4
VKYRTIVADPPWHYNSAATKADANKHYATMTQEAIEALPVSTLAEASAHLWLWATNGQMEYAFRVVRAWGFSPLTVVTWCKPGPGVGHYLRNNTEHVIFASRGVPEVPAEKALSTWYQWPRQPHSQKPDAFYDLVEQISPGPRVELFARRHRFFWDVWGNESANTAQLDTSA